MGEPDRCQGPVRQLVVLDHCVAGREDLVHHDCPLDGHRRKGALVFLRVNPFHRHRLESTARPVEHKHLLPGLDLTGEDRRPPLMRGVDEEEVRRGEGDLLTRVGFDHVEEPPGRRVPVYERDEVGVNQVPVVVRCQHLVTSLEVFHRLRGSILEGD